MQSREIIVANTKTQKRYKFESEATTLGELKADMIAHEIDYSGMSFTEGISKTQLLDDSSLLPTNLSYKGQTTNNLVILLTNTEKKIASGMDRAEAFSLIEEEDNNEECETQGCELLDSIYDTIKALIAVDVISNCALNCFIQNLQALAEEIRKPDPVSMVIGTTTITGDDVDAMINGIH